MASLDYFFGLHEFEDSRVQHLFRKYAFVGYLFDISFNLSATFMVLYLINALNYTGAATISAVMLTTQLIFDYPFGSMGDWIGQRWVIVSATITALIAFLLFSVASSFNQFLVIGILFGFSNAQASGTFQSWLDNQYQRLDVDDPERKNYGFTMTRINSISNLIMGITFIVGGILATTFSRAYVFRLQAIVIGVLTIFLFFLMTEIPVENEGHRSSDTNTAETIDELQEKKSSYFTYLVGGLKFATSSLSMALFILSMGMLQSMWNIWGNLMLFPLYFSYAGSDSIASLLRSIIFFSGVIAAILLSGHTKKVKKLSLPKFQYFTIFGLFTGGGLLLILLPAYNSYNLLGLIFVFLLMLVTVNVINPFTNALFMRVIVDLVPSKNRNAMYSLIPSIAAIFAIPGLMFAGWLIETYSLSTGFFLLLALGTVGSILMQVSLNVLLRAENEQKLEKSRVTPIAQIEASPSLAD